MKNQALFSLIEKIIKVSSAAILLGALRVNRVIEIKRGAAPNVA